MALTTHHCHILESISLSGNQRDFTGNEIFSPEQNSPYIFLFVCLDVHIGFPTTLDSETNTNP